MSNEDSEPIELCLTCKIPYSYNSLENIMYCERCGKQK